MKNKTFEIIEMMRFPLIYLVVMAHLLPFDRIPIELNLSTQNIYVFISELISHHIAKIPVPLFFIISGYFFLKVKKFTLKTYQEKISKKISTLLVPYITWNTIAVLAVIIVNYLGSAFFSRPKEELPNIYNIYFGFPINFSLWYVRDLMIMMILTPIFYYYIKYLKSLGLLILYIAYLFIHISPITGISTTSILFFTIGIYLAINNIDIIKLTQRYKKTIAVISILLLLTSVMFNGTYYHEYLFRLFIIPGIITLFNLFYYLSFKEKTKSWLIALAPTSFFIYVTHQIYIINWIKGAFARSPFFSTAIGQIISYFISPIICVTVCITLFMILKSTLPKLLKLSIGQRYFKVKEQAL